MGSRNKESKESSWYIKEDSTMLVFFILILSSLVVSAPDIKAEVANRTPEDPTDSNRCCGDDSVVDDYCNDPSTDPYDGLGCNACGIQNCRVCGVAGYIDCYPSIVDQNTDLIELLPVEDGTDIVELLPVEEDPEAVELLPVEEHPEVVDLLEVEDDQAAVQLEQMEED